MLGQPSTGAGCGPGSDLACATQLAAASVMALGLDEVAGLVWSGVPTAASLPDLLAADPALARRVRALLDDAYRDALVLVRANRGAVDAVTDTLLARRALDGPEVTGIVAWCAPIQGGGW